MIYMSVAIKAEAGPLIRHFGLKKNTKMSKFPVYENTDIRLVVTGTGGKRALSGSVFLLTTGNATGQDFFINTGIAGLAGEKKDTALGDLFLINSVTDYCTGKRYYPDMIYKTDLPEEKLLTVPFASDNYIPDVADRYLVDMEGSYIFHGAGIFMGPENIFILKTVSDFCEPGSVDFNFAENLMEKNIKKTEGLVMDIIQKYSPFISRQDNSEYTELAEKTAIKLRLTAYQKSELCDLYRMYIRGENKEKKLRDISEFINSFGHVKEKREGKAIYEKIKNRLTEI